MFNTKEIIARNEKNINEIKRLEQVNQQTYNMIDTLL
jgi:hypothetical protein